MIGAVNQYTYRAEWSPESGEYIGLCLEFPSRYSRAQSAHEAIEGIERVIDEESPRWSIWVTRRPHH